MGSGLETPTAPDFAANDEKMRLIGAPHSRHSDNEGAVTGWIYSNRLVQDGCRRHCSAKYSYIGMVRFSGDGNRVLQGFFKPLGGPAGMESTMENRMVPTWFAA